MIQPIRIGIAGTGFAGRFHLENYPESGVEVVGVTSARPESREAFASRHGIRAFASVEEMLPEIDALDICTPPSSHSRYILQAAAAGRHVIVEKPLTGFYGSPEHNGKQRMLEEVAAEAGRLREAVRSAGIVLGYAENFVYAPSIQKEREIVEKTRAQILRMTGEESHSGSHSPVYGVWSVQGGGSLIAKGCHPLGAILYLKRKEGLARTGRPIRPKAVSARTHSITRLPAYEDKGFLRTRYQDTEDYALLHVIFEDGTVAEVMASELVLGGIYDFVEVFANNHRTRCRMSPVSVIDVYNPRHEQFKDLYLVEKISSNEGWIPASPEEGWSLGYGKELRDFVESIRTGRTPQSDLDLAIDTTLTLYAGYVSAEGKGTEVDVPWIDARD
ncbi:MAG TPA: Gfo/Idh/MocA family oxidoreductase [Bryobacteraceae bacterium]|jgi:predicted dehydrogenase|nr:Gfo/Idh/MocA family oxidoreductase [Bryobacteraceae bacterium]